jgi:RNA polymerase sigma-70 factor (ECF subfamily)
LTEQDLITGLKEGNTLAFKELVANYQLPVINTCLGIVQNRHDAEDLTQDVFVEIFRSVASFRADSKLSTWIYRIAVNKSLNFVRKQKKRRWISSLEDFLKVKTEPETSGYGISELERSETGREIHQALASLPENQRIAFTLNKYDELSYKEIAEVMNLSVPSVESLIHRAKQGLQKKLWASYKKVSI